MIHNRIEEKVEEAYRALRKNFRDFCGCEICQADVLVYALNRLPARYVASQEGLIITELNLDQQQSRASVDVVLMEAFAKVQASPRCKQTGKPKEAT